MAARKTANVTEVPAPRSTRIITCANHKLTVCPSNDSASMLSYQELPTSIQVWRGYGQEAKIR